MSSHDEYSEDEDDSIGEQAESQVFLGMNDGSFGDELPGIEDTFIGGYPIWMHPSLTPSEEMTKCKNCGKKMALLLQAFAPLDGKLYDRVIYVFGCNNNATCLKKKGSIRAIRGVSKDPQKMAQLQKEQDEALAESLKQQMELEESHKRQQEMTKNLFTKADSTSTSIGNPFDSNPFNSASNPFGAQAEPKKNEKPSNANENAKPKETNGGKAETPQPSIKPDTSFPAYPGYFVYVEQEKFKQQALEPELEKYRHLIEKEDGSQTQSKQRTPSISLPAEMEPTLKIQGMLEDKYFQAFSETVGYNPGQVLRYDLGGKPLLYSGQDAVAKKYAALGAGLPIPAYNPSSERQYELQIMPKAILDLEEQLVAESTAQEYIANGMEWGTIIVATDKEDFMPNLDEHGVGYIEEWCDVQWEESV